MKLKIDSPELDVYCGMVSKAEKAIFQTMRIEEIDELRKGLLAFWSCLSLSHYNWPPFVETHKQIGDYDLFITLKKREKEAQ